MKRSSYTPKRRLALKAVSGGALVSSLAGKLPVGWQTAQAQGWQRPLVQTAVLPAHVQMSSAERLLVLGDSLSAHFGLNEAEGWVALLQNRINTAGHALMLINASLSGETTGGGASRLPALLSAYQPDWVFIALGANDGLGGLSLADLKNNLIRMVDLTRAAGARPLLSGLLSHMNLPPTYGDEYRARFAALFPEAAMETGTPLLPFLLEGVGGIPELNLPDGLHPNAAGQQIMTDTVWRFLVREFAW